MIRQNFKIYKPYGMLSQMLSNDHKERKKQFLSELRNFPEGIMPVGRLDEKSEGLLLLTTDGKLSDEINRSGVEKEYLAQLDGIISKQAIEMMKFGVEIGLSGKRYRTKPCEASIIQKPSDLPEPDEKLRIGRHRPSSWVSITLKEGKYRQIRKMTAAVGFPTLRLIRIRIGSVELNGMQPGDVLPLIKFIP